MQICLLLVALNSWVYLPPASQKWCWRTSTAGKKSQAAILSPPLSVLAIHLPIFFWLLFFKSAHKSVFLDLTLSSYFLSLSPLLLLSPGFGSVVVIKDIAGLDLLFVVTSPIVLSAGVPVSTAITATTLKYCCGSHNLRQFYREEGRLCHRFLPSMMKDSFEFRTTCRS